MDESYCCPICSPTAFDIVSVPDFGYPNSHIGRYLTLIYISLMTHDVYHLFICLLATCISLARCLFRSLAHFLTEWFVFFLLTLRVVCMFWIIVFYQRYLLQIFCLDTVFHTAKVLSFYQLQLISRFFHAWSTWCYVLKSIVISQVFQIFSCVIFLGILHFYFTFIFLIHFELIFV